MALMRFILQIKMKNLKQRIKEGILALGIVAFGVSSLASEELIPLLKYPVEEKMVLEVKNPELLGEEAMQRMKLDKQGYISLNNFYSEELEKYKISLTPNYPITVEAKPYFVYGN